jgi:trimeric autotransporter adhesin
MSKFLYFKNAMMILLFITIIIIAAPPSYGQLTGIKTIPGDYATIALAVADLNTSGVGTGGVTFNVAAGHTETTTDVILITATGISGNAIIFQKNGSGANPLVTRTDAGATGTTVLGADGDAVIRLNGTDYITFNGIDVTATDAGIEYGYYTFKPTGENGCQFVSILNCKVALAGGSNFLIGIHISNGPTTAGSATGVTVTAESGINSNVKINGNTVQNVHTGIYLRGSAAAGFLDNHFTIGESGAGNTIQNFGGTTTSYGLYAIYLDNIKIAHSTFSGAGTGILYGIFTSTAVNSNVDIFENTISLNSTAASSAMYGISNAMGGTGTNNTLNIYNNIVENCTMTSTGAWYGIYNSASAFNVNIYGNIVRNNSKTSASGASYLIYNLGGGTNGTSNIHGNSVYGNVSTGTGIFYCLYSNEAATTAKLIYNNSIYNNLSGGDLYGINSATGSVTHIYKNNIYDLTSTTTLTTSPYTSGITVGTGIDIYVYNNFISDLKAPNSAATDAIRGISFTSATTNATRNVYYNTIFLNASSSGANFGSSGIYHTNSTTATTSSLDMRNNIIVNTSKYEGTGLTVAFRRSAANANLNNYSEVSNNNLFYAGTPGPSNLIFSAGTDADQFMSDFKVRVSPREAASLNYNPVFVNSLTAPYNLHINTTVPTPLESGGAPVTAPIAVIDDYDGDLRNLTTPDIGADEFIGIGADVTPPVIVYDLLNNSSSLISASLTAEITDISGIASGANSPRLYYKKYSDAAYAFDNTPVVSGNNYTFTLTYSTIGGVVIGDTIVYYVAAQDLEGNSTTNPVGGSGSNPPGTTPPANLNGYFVTDLPLSGVYTIGLSAFNRIHGKDVYFETVTTTEVISFNSTDSPIDVTENLADAEVTSVKYVLMENGQPFNNNFFRGNDFRGVYPTITAASEDINLRGISGPVVFSLVDEVYSNETYPITLTNIIGTSSTNTVTIKPAAGINVLIPGNPSQSTSTFRLGGADYVIIDGSNTIGGTTKNLTIKAQTTTAPAVHFYGGATNNVVKNLHLESQNTSTTSGALIFAAGDPNINNQVINCTITNYSLSENRYANGVYFFGANANSYNQLRDLEIINFTSRGIYVQGNPSTDVLIEGCNIYNTIESSSATIYPIQVANTPGAVISANRIYDIKTTAASPTISAIYLYGASANPVNIVVKNNLINIGNELTAGTIRGIDGYGFAGNSFEIYFNTSVIGGESVTA